MKKTALLLSALLLCSFLFSQPAPVQVNPDVTGNPPENSMQKAYSASASIIKSQLISESSVNDSLIREIAASDLVVVEGVYDHIHLVLSFLELPFVRITPEQFAAADLQPHQTVFINCGANFSSKAARKLARFVADGGQLITTDWAIKDVLEVAFPNVVKFNGRYTGDEVVRIEVADRNDPVIKGFLNEETAPVWWLEGSSYPIEVLDKEKVQVLIKSKELEERYGEGAVLVKFNHGKGVVYHMISHFYLQRSETKDAVQEQGAALYFNSKNIVLEDAVIMQMDKDGVNYGDVQSANTSSEFIMRAVIEQKKRAESNAGNDNKNK